MGAEIAERIGLDTPVNTDQIQMLLEENVIQPGVQRAHRGVRHPPTFLCGGAGPAGRLAPREAALRRRRRAAPPALLDRHRRRSPEREGAVRAFRRDFAELAPSGLVEVGAEPGTARTLEEGATLTLEVPLRGHIQVRVEEVDELSATCVTVEGHHLAGVIRFLVSEEDLGLRFEIRSYARASHLLDSLGMAAVGSPCSGRPGVAWWRRSAGSARARPPAGSRRSAGARRAATPRRSSGGSRRW
jgi:hypothetical protein